MFYSGDKLLGMKDLEGKKPEIYISTGNRASGKTTFFNKKLVDDFLKYGKQFALIYRFNYELTNVENAFFDDIRGLFFKEHNMEAISQARGMYKALILNGKQCGFAVCLNSADTIKRNSHVFNQVQQIVFDEFQSETNKYCENEISKFISLHTSIARGQGQHSRYVPTYLISNCVSILNPYYQSLGVFNRLRPDTKFLRGNGWCLEQNLNLEASEQIKNSAFMQAFSKESQFGYATENMYLNDSSSFIAKMTGRGKYICTLKTGNELLSLKEYKDQDIIYCDRSADKSFPLAIAVDIDSHSESTLFSKNSMLITMLRDVFHKGRFRFKDALCRLAVFQLLRY